MRIVFMGTPDFAAVSLAKLIAAREEVVAVVTQPDRPRGRGQKLQASSVKVLAQEHGLGVLQPVRVAAPDFLRKLEALQPDLIIVAAFGQKIPQEILSLPPLGCINVHASLLPRWRGAAPIQYAIMAGDEKTGVSIMQMDSGWDTGDLILQQEVPITPTETGGSLHDKLAVLGGELLLEAIAELGEDRAQIKPQPEVGVTYAPKLDREISRIPWERSARELERLLRALDPFPGARTKHGGRPLFLWKGKVREGSDQAPGTVLASDGEIVVETGEGALAILELQRAGGVRMEAASFLNGYDLPPGTVLG